MPPVTVREGETTTLPFGPPYKLMVEASGRGGTTVSLALKIVGTAGEVCNNMMVDGKRPGNFEYG